jgi:small conductance mechanosensitive channel
VVATLRRIGSEIREEPAFAPFILEPIEVMGVDAFSDKSIMMKARIRTVPLKQWEVGRELRRRIVKAFDREGIVMVAPERFVALKESRAGQ